MAGVAAGLVFGIPVAWFAPWQVSALTGWCAGAGTLLLLAWAVMLRSDSERTRSIATSEDETRLTTDLIVLASSVASLVAVAMILAKASKSNGVAVPAMTALGVFSVVVAWALVHTVYALRYADLYYSDKSKSPGDPKISAIDFNEDDPPDYRDFAYLAFTIGMTYQVSDTDLKTKDIRRTALKHGLLSYLFGTAVIAVTINIVAGLAG